MAGEVVRSAQEKDKTKPDGRGAEGGPWELAHIIMSNAKHINKDKAQVTMP